MKSKQPADSKFSGGTGDEKEQHSTHSKAGAKRNLS